MIIGLLKEAVSWFVSLTEVGLVIAAMLVIGLVVGMTGFWILGRCLSKLGGPPAELDPYADEPATSSTPQWPSSEGNREENRPIPVEHRWDR
jgi:hypothetical protein